jgi:ketosteroid isomerase-like protein
MPGENVEVAKRSIDAYNRRDLEAYEEIWTADYESLPAMAGRVDSNAFRGRRGIEAYFADVDNAWEEFLLFPDDVRDLGGQRVLILGRSQGRGRASGLLVAAEWGLVCEFRDGRISRARAYMDHGEALEAVGLEE